MRASSKNFMIFPGPETRKPYRADRAFGAEG
jgi:hypothetical protein